MRVFKLGLVFCVVASGAFAQADKLLPRDPRAITPEIALKWNVALASATGSEREQLLQADAKLRAEYPDVAKLLDATKPK